MDLAITASSLFGTPSSGQGRNTTRPESEPTPPAAAPGADDGERASAAENTTGRPVRETRQAGELTPDEQRVLNQLKQRDREVKAHELAHRAAGGRYVTGGSFTYQNGPDGHRYAIGGEVSIDASAGRTPEETLRKAEQIRRAALAPAEPSPQDHRVAAAATQMAVQARTEIAAQRQSEAAQMRETRQSSGDGEARTQAGFGLNSYNRRAIASFESVSGIGRLQSAPDPVDEMI